MLVANKTINDAWLAPRKELNIKIKIDGVVYDKSDVSSLSFDSASIVGDAFQIGSAYMNQIQVEFPSIIESIAQDLEVTAELGIYVDGAFHYSKLGTFLISEFDRNRNERKTTFTAVDRMVLLEGSYVSKLSYPASIRNVALEIANLAGVVIDQVSFSTLPTTTIAKPEGYTYRQAIGLIAQFVGGFANFNREGKLQVRTLALTDFALTTADYMWGGFTKNESTYRVNGIQVITGDEESNVLSVGADKGNVIQLENKVMTQALLNTIWQRVQNINYSPYELKWFGNPNLEAGDWINIVDHDGVRYSVPNLSYSFTYNGGLRAESKATTTSNSEVSYRYKGTLAQKIIEIEKVLTAANGWNSNYYDQTEPPLHPKEGDAWFKPNGAYTEIWLYKNVDGELKWVLEISNAPDEAIKEAIENMEQEVQTAIDQSQTAIDNASQAIADAGFAKNQASSALTQAGQAVADANTAITDAQSALDAYRNMEIGGVNILEDTLFMRNMWYFTKQYPQESSIVENALQINSNGNGWAQWQIQSSASGSPTRSKILHEIGGGNYTISYEARVVGSVSSSGRIEVQLRSNHTNGSTKTPISVIVGAENLTSEWVKFKGTVFLDIPENLLYWRAIFQSTIIGKVEIRKMKLEKGNKATDWSPAPEDVQVQITDINGELSRKVSQQTFDTLQGTVNTQSTQINQNKADILLRATKTEVNTLTGTVNSLDSQLKLEAGKISALNSKTDGHTTEIGSLESSFSGLNSTVATVKQDLDGLEIGQRNYAVNTMTPLEWVNNIGSNTGIDHTSCTCYKFVGGLSLRNLIKKEAWNTNTDISVSGIVEFFRLDGLAINYSDFPSRFKMSIFRFTGSGSSWNQRGVIQKSDLIDGINTYEIYESWKLDQRDIDNADISGTKLWCDSFPTGYGIRVKDYMFTLGNKKGPYFPAPEDMTTVTAFSALEQNLSGFKTTVENTYADKTTVNQLAGQWQATTTLANGHTSQISSLGTQVNLRATKAEFADALGAVNLITNGGNIQSTAGWSGTVEISKHPYYKSNTANVLTLITAGTSEVTASGEYFNIEPNTEYTLTFYGFASSNVRSMDVHFLSRKNTSSNGYDNAKLLLSTNLSPGQLDRRSVTFTTNATDNQAYIRFDNNGSTNGALSGLYVVDITLVKGSVAPSAWFESTADSIVSQINISPESILLSSKKIQIKGDTYIDNGVIQTAHIADLAVSGAKIANASISSAKIISLDASKITVGTLTGHTINGAVINGGTISGGTINGTNITGGTFYNSGTRGEFHVYDGMVKATSYNTVANGTILSEDGYITLRAGGTGSASHVFLQSVTEVRATRPREFNTYIPMVASGFRIPGWTYLARNVWSTYGNGIEDMFVKPSDVGSMRVMSDGNGTYRPIMASAFNQSSSREFKENVSALHEKGLSVINELKVVTYNLREDAQKEVQVGLIAEDSLKVASLEGNSINLYKLTTYNTKAIQELDLKSTEITNEIAQIKGTHANDIFVLKSEIQELKNEIQALRQSA